MKNGNLLILILLFSFSFLLASEVRVEAPDSDIQEFAELGSAVSISGDFIVVGAPFGMIDCGGAGCDQTGKAYIFERSGPGNDDWDFNVWELWANPSVADDEFGYSVSIDGYAVAGKNAIVGAPFADELNTDDGAAYIFDRFQGGSETWGEAKKLSVSPGASNLNFGFSVSINGDYALVGAIGDNSNAGAAFLYGRNFGGIDNWGLVKKLTASGAASDSEFGSSVSISGDLIVVGASVDDHGGGSSNDLGAAYIFSRNFGGAENWGQVKKLTASDAQNLDRFGGSVSISGNNVIVGAVGEDAGGAGAGAAYVFNRNQGGTDNWGQVSKLTASDAAASDEFGYSVSINGDYALVGAPGENTETGAAYAFLRSGSSWSQTSKSVSLFDGDNFDRYGESVAINADNSVMGSPGDDPWSEDEGTFYVYENIADLSLPVELTSFTATPGNSQILLKWTTASELNNAAFILERSEDGNIFETVSRIDGQGSVSYETNYSFVDENVLNGFTYYYRLADLDYSGVLTYHSIISATPNSEKGFFSENGMIEKFALHGAYPNPFNPQTTISFDVPTTHSDQHNLKLNIYNNLGMLVTTLHDGALSGGQYKMKWNAEDQPSGVYYIHLQSDQFSLAHKMILLR
ncbi:MAG: T9SS C-terminal target domain-containing protein [Calditrichaeota bacterium]|nr:MAG: T9SS C-terminal target domain-containing protein [Calditrichota bacterium]MBL1205923.1 T9SS C-terminal target domain-containing protein [Calditrichota bacterium]NOG45751.1 T9SS type A sorting domain-containing protein [Calditrichota bacterium]